MNKDPWYTRTELWGTLASFLLPPICAACPALVPFIGKAAVLLPVVLPSVYVGGRSLKKVADALPINQILDALPKRQP